MNAYADDTTFFLKKQTSVKNPLITSLSIKY